MNSLIEQLKTYAKLLAIPIAGLFFIGFGISADEPMPPYARVYIDDATKIYFSLPCLEEWQHRQTSTVSFVALSTYGQAKALNYTSDPVCREAGGFQGHPRSLSRLILEILGVLPPLEHWWDRPYRDEQGNVVFPKEKE